jgi:hypothetical protein
MVSQLYPSGSLFNVLLLLLLLLLLPPPFIGQYSRIHVKNFWVVMSHERLKHWYTATTLHGTTQKTTRNITTMRASNLTTVKELCWLSNVSILLTQFNMFLYTGLIPFQMDLHKFLLR